MSPTNERWKLQYKGLRDWIDQVEKLGELQRMASAHWDLELGAITRLSLEQDEPPAILFDEIKDYPKGYRVLAHPMHTLKRLALTLGMPLELKPLEMVQAWKARLGLLKEIPPGLVKDGPVMENVQTGKEIDLLKFPSPRWNEMDGGRFIGTGCAVITRDPDTGWVNLGTYRVMVHDRDTLGFYVSPGRHGRIHRNIYFQRGQPCPVAISFGHEPLVAFAASEEVPYGTCEYDFIGAIKGEPVEVVEAPATGLPVPADAEIVIEGEAHPQETKVEGPFGEFTGYYGSSARPEPFIKVKTVMHRTAPIIMGIPHYRAHGRGSGTQKSILTPARIWHELEAAGLPDIQGVWCVEAATANLMIVVSIKQRYPGHARQAAVLASQCRSGAYMGKYVVIVDEDVDITNLKDVIWAVCTRSDPEHSIEIFRRCWGTPLDPAIPKDRAGLNSRAIIDACRPYEWKEDFPLVSDISQELREKTLNKWAKRLGLEAGTKKLRRRAKA